MTIKSEPVDLESPPERSKHKKRSRAEHGIHHETQEALQHNPGNRIQKHVNEVKIKTEPTETGVERSPPKKQRRETVKRENISGSEKKKKRKNSC